MLEPKRHLAAALLAACALGLVGLEGCAVGPDYRPRAPEALGVPQAYGVTAAPAAAVGLTTWWGQLNDPLLTQLIDKATAGNLDIAVSRARLLQAREQLIQTRSSLFPSLSGSAGAGQTATWARKTTTTVFGVPVASGGDSSSSQLSLGLDASWQVDIFGGTRRSVEAAEASRDAAIFNLAGVRTAVAGEVATNYIQARVAQARLAIARDTLKNQDDNLQIAGWRAEAGLAPSTDSEQARAQRAQTAASIPLLENSFFNAVSRLGVLTGQAPSALRQALEAVAPIPHGPEGVAVGLPADTLRQRPDVRAAERNLAVATAQIGVAEAQLYPSLSLTGSLDTNAARIATLGQTEPGQVLASLRQKLYAAGRQR